MFSAMLCGMCVLSHFSRVRLFATPRTVAHQAPLSMEFSRQECWGGLLRPPPGDLHDPRIKPTSHVPCVGRQVLYHLGSPCFLGILVKEWSFIISVFLLLDGFT